MRAGRAGPWYTDIRTRIRFERGVREAYPAINVTATGRSMHATVVYSLAVEVPEYPSRRVTIALPNWSMPTVASVTADGPTESPHRYGERELCI